MQHLDDGTIHAWLDGALGAGRAREVEAHVAACRACAARVAEARGFIAGASRILASLDDVPGGVVPDDDRLVAAASPARAPAPVFAAAASAAPAAPAIAAPHSRWGHRYGRIAAVLAFVAAGTFVLTREANRGASVAHRELSGPAVRRDSMPAAFEAAQPAAAPAAPVASGPRRGAPPALGGAVRAPLPAPAASPAAPPAAKTLAAESRQRPAAALESANRATVRVLGQAAKAADAAPRLVSVDSVPRGPAMVRRDTYDIGSGTQVVLETTPPSALPNDSLAAANAPAMLDSVPGGAPGVHVLRWRGADGTRYALSGPVSIDVLQRVRAALGKAP